jgi:hypothetical protein
MVYFWRADLMQQIWLMRCIIIIYLLNQHPFIMVINGKSQKKEYFGNKLIFLNQHFQ